METAWLVRPQWHRLFDIIYIIEVGTRTHALSQHSNIVVHEKEYADDDDDDDRQ